MTVRHGFIIGFAAGLAAACAVGLHRPTPEPSDSTEAVRGYLREQERASEIQAGRLRDAERPVSANFMLGYAEGRRDMARDAINRHEDGAGR